MNTPPVKIVDGSQIRQFTYLEFSAGRKSGGFELIINSNFKSYMDLSREGNSILPVIQLMASGNINAL